MNLCGEVSRTACLFGKNSDQCRVTIAASGSGRARLLMAIRTPPVINSVGLIACHRLAVNQPTWAASASKPPTISTSGPAIGPRGRTARRKITRPVAIASAGMPLSTAEPTARRAYAPPTAHAVPVATATRPRAMRARLRIDDLLPLRTPITRFGPTCDEPRRVPIDSGSYVRDRVGCARPMSTHSRHAVLDLSGSCCVVKCPGPDGLMRNPPHTFASRRGTLSSGSPLRKRRCCAETGLVDCSGRSSVGSTASGGSRSGSPASASARSTSGRSGGTSCRFSASSLQVRCRRNWCCGGPSC